MAQEILLAPGNTNATSNVLTVQPGLTATVGIYSPTRIDVASLTSFVVLLATPGAENCVDFLTNAKRQVIVGPGTYRVQRRNYDGPPFGVFVER